MIRSGGRSEPPPEFDILVATGDAIETLTVQDVTIPRLGLGTWEVTGETVERAVAAALDAGYRHLDTAQAYENEAEVGRALAASGVDRDDVFLTTKIWRDNATADAVRSSTEASLEKLGVDHVDLLLLHWPSDEIAPLKETMDALDRLRQDGLTRLIGVSNFPSRRLREAASYAPIATNQVEYHPFLDQSVVLSTARELGITLTAYSPLGHGKVFENDTIERIAGVHDTSAANVTLRWLLDQDDVIAIPRSSDPDHVRSNFDVGIELTDIQRAALDGLPKEDRQIDPPFAPDWD